MAAPSLPTNESYLIIGGGTSLGETIVEQLLRRGETRVAVFDAQPLAAEQAARFGDAVRVCVGDILVPESISEAIKSVRIPHRFLGILYQHLGPAVRDNVHHSHRHGLHRDDILDSVHVGR